MENLKILSETLLDNYMITIDIKKECTRVFLSLASPLMPFPPAPWYGKRGTEEFAVAKDGSSRDAMPSVAMRPCRWTRALEAVAHRRRENLAPCTKELRALFGSC